MWRVAWTRMHGAEAINPPRLLSTRRERPRSRYAAEERDELAALHSITSLVSASTSGGTVRPSALAVLRLMINLTLMVAS